MSIDLITLGLAATANSAVTEFKSPQGAAVVGAQDGVSGALFTNVQGAINYADAIAQPAVINSTTTVPPTSPTNGSAYIVPAGATGVWAAHVNSLAVWQLGAWAHYVPVTGWIAFDIAANYLKQWNGTAWVIAASASSLILPPQISDAAANGFAAAQDITLITGALYVNTTEGKFRQYSAFSSTWADYDASAQAAAAVAQAAVLGLPYFPVLNASTGAGGGNILPQGIISGTIGGTAITGATPGTYALTPTGGNFTGVQANLVVTSSTAATIQIVQPGRTTSATPTAPTWANPSGATIPSGTTLTPSIGVQIGNGTGQYYLTSDTGGLNLLYWQNIGTGVPVSVSDGVGGQVSYPLSSQLTAFLVTIEGIQADAAGSAADALVLKNDTSVLSNSASVSAGEAATTLASVETLYTEIDALIPNLSAIPGQIAEVTALANGSAIGVVIDSNQNIVIGTDAVAPTGAGAGSTIYGYYAGYGTNITNPDRLFAFGLENAAYIRGLSPVVIGAYSAQRANADQSAYFGVHTAQDFNVFGSAVYGSGTRAAGNLNFTTQPADGETQLINGVLWTYRASPASANDIGIGASVQATCLNAFEALGATTDAATTMGLYSVASAAPTLISIVSAGPTGDGNSFTLAASSGGAVTVSGATLTGGTISTVGASTGYGGQLLMGWTSAMGSMISGATYASMTLPFSGNPADGDYLLLGFGGTKQVNFKTTPVGALDVQIGATTAITLANTVALLSASVDATLDTCTYYASGVALVIINKTLNVNTFEVASHCSVITAPARTVRGGQTNAGPNVAAGNAAQLSSALSNSISLGNLVGGYSTGNDQTVLGSGQGINGNNIMLATPGTSCGFFDGDSIQAIGDITSIQGLSSAQPWFTLASVGSDGTITFAAPHGWRVGSIYKLDYQDDTAGASVIQQTVYGGGATTNIAKTGGLRVTVISANAVLIIQTPSVGSNPPSATTTPSFTFGVSGTVGNLQVRRYYAYFEYMAVIGSGATPRIHAINIGSAKHIGGTQIDTLGLSLNNGQFNSHVVPTPAPGNGFVTFPTNFTAGDAVSVSDGTNTYTMTAHATADFATPTSGSETWFAIGASNLVTVQNMLYALGVNDDQSAARRIMDRAQWSVKCFSSSVRLSWLLYDTDGAHWIVTSTKSNATVTVTGTGGVGNLPISTSIHPPAANDIALISNSSRNDGGTGFAKYQLSPERWTFL